MLLSSAHYSHPSPHPEGAQGASPAPQNPLESPHWGREEEEGGLTLPGLGPSQGTVGE